MPLPIQTSADDAIRICEYLRTKPTGTTIQDAAAIVGSTYTDNRKLQGYEAWGLIERTGSSIAASPLGRQLGQSKDVANVQKVFSVVVVSVDPYRKAVEYLRSQGLSEITTIDLGAWWHRHMAQEVGLTADKSLVSAVNSFFTVAEAAGIGAFKVGRRGAGSRLEGVNTQRAAEVLDGTQAIEISEHGESLAAGEAHEPDGKDEVERLPAQRKTSTGVERVFIAHGKNTDIVQQIADMLLASGLQPEIAEADETTAIPVPDKVFEAMHRCQAGIICVTRETAEEASPLINQNVLIEIGAAFVLYERQVILVWDQSLPVPSNLQGLYRCELESNRLSWDEGVKLLRAIGKFKVESTAA